MKNIVVVGGGTAGWLTALYAKKIFPNDCIIVIESKNIGILGAGEGSTPPLINLLDFLDIPVSDLIEKTKTTIKQGVKFTGWSDSNPFYYHGFDIIDTNLNNYQINNSVSIEQIRNIPYDIFQNYLKNKNILEYDLVAMSSEKNKVLFRKYDKINNSNPINDFYQYGKFSIHFDAKLLAERLHQIGSERKINTIYGTVKTINNNLDGDIQSLLMDNDEIIKTDFVFDCTGFSHFFIGKHFNSEWVSFSDSLPMKKAIPFFIDIDKENIATYTESIAMNYGWMWKIPLQHRYGCGYVYDSNFISDDDAKKEIENFLGYVPIYPKETPFIFNPGCYKEIWKNNCIAVGLSGSFLEPLEATAIWQAIILLQEIFNKKENIFNKNKTVIKNVNEKYFKQTCEVRDFIYLHYMTNKTNNAFWKNFIENNLIPETLKEKLDLIKNSILYDSDHTAIFSSNSYYRICAALEIIEKENINKIIKYNDLFYLDGFTKNQNKDKNEVINYFSTHTQLLKHLGGLK